MNPASGPISDRLRDQLPADDPAWTPDRSATTPPTTRTASEGRPITGRQR